MDVSVKVLEVSVGVIKNESNLFLITQRADNAEHGSGLWEFPGGKLELGESSYQALCRELKEEINIEVRAAKLLLSVAHQYPEFQVILHNYLVLSYSGVADPQENQPMRWVSWEDLAITPLLEANQLILKKLSGRL